MIDADRLDFTDLEGTEFAAAIDDIESELQAAANWIDDAFGEIEAEASRLAPAHFLKSTVFPAMERVRSLFAGIVPVSVGTR